MSPTARPQPFTARAKLVERMRRRLEAQSYPRLQMSLIVSLTGLAGLLVSASLLKLGLHSMAWRYPLSLLIAYGVFLGLLWLWLRSRAEDWADVGDMLDAADVASDLARPVVQGVSRAARGIADNALHPVAAGRAQPSTLASSAAESPGWGDADVSVGDADELAIVLLVLGFVLALAAAAVYVVYQAPVLMAEVALDGALVGSLYHRLRQGERQHWLHAAWTHTRWPLLAMLALVWLVGWGLGYAAPGAVTLGQAWAMV
jgi:hypothetical protein